MEYYSKGEDRLLQKHFSSFLIYQPVIVQESYVLPFTQGTRIYSDPTSYYLQESSRADLKQLALPDRQQSDPSSQTSLSRQRLAGREGTSALDYPKKEQSLISAGDLKSKELPLYDAVIPIILTRYISYGLNLLHQKEIKAFPKRLASTSQVLTYVFDVFFMKITPENQFELLQEYFNYTLLFLFIAGLALSVLLVRNYVSKQKR